MGDLSEKIERAVRLLQSIPQDGPIELSYSGGKDSDVILELAKISGIPFEPIYKNTTIDPPGTIQHCKDNGVTIVPPKKTFLQVMAEKGMPSRFRRFCCSELKEYKIHDRASKESAVLNRPNGPNFTRNRKNAGFIMRKKKSAFTFRFWNGLMKTSKRSSRNKISDAHRSIIAKMANSTSNGVLDVSVAH